MLHMGLKTDGAVSIGDVSIKLKTPSSPELVPVKYGELSRQSSNFYNMSIKNYSDILLCILINKSKENQLKKSGLSFNPHF